MTNPNARTRAWTRLSKLTGLPPGTERRAVLERAAEMLEEAAIAKRHADQAILDDLTAQGRCTAEEARQTILTWERIGF